MQIRVQMPHPAVQIYTIQTGHMHLPNQPAKVLRCSSGSP